jgi:predicted TIM-barrel enzyme
MINNYKIIQKLGLKRKKVTKPRNKAKTITRIKNKRVMKNNRHLVIKYRKRLYKRIKIVHNCSIKHKIAKSKNNRKII